MFRCLPTEQAEVHTVVRHAVVRCHVGTDGRSDRSRLGAVHD